MTKAGVVGSVVVLFCGLAYVMVGAAKLRTKAVEFSSDTAAAFSKWGFATEYLIQVPQGAKNIKAIAYPGSNLYNVDYAASASDFDCLGDSLGVSPTLILSTVPVRPLYRGGQWRKVRKGFRLELRVDELPSGVMVDIWYDAELSEVLYRQVGRPEKVMEMKVK